MFFVIVINLDIEISNFRKKTQKPYIHTYLRKKTKINNDGFIYKKQKQKKLAFLCGLWYNMYML